MLGRPCRWAAEFQGLVLPLPLALVAPVLEPDLDLSGGELEAAGQELPLGSRKVALLLEASLQLENLSLREEHPRLPPAARLGTLRGLLRGLFACNKSERRKG